MKNKTGPFFLAALLSLCAALFATNTWAEDSKTWAEDIWTRDKLTGDWWGGRTYLSDHGIDIGLRLSQYYQSVASGGVDQNSEYGGTMDYRVNVNTNKLFGTWKGFSVDMHARTRYGQDVLADAGGITLPNTGMLMPLPGDYSGTQITGLTVNQFFPVGEQHIGLATLGKLDILDAVTLFFPHVGYGQEGFWNVNSLVSALPWFGAVDGLSLYGGWLATINKEQNIKGIIDLFPEKIIAVVPVPHPCHINIPQEVGKNAFQIILGIATDGSVTRIKGDIRKVIQAAEHRDLGKLTDSGKKGKLEILITVLDNRVQVFEYFPCLSGNLYLIKIIQYQLVVLIHQNNDF